MQRPPNWIWISGLLPALIFALCERIDAAVEVNLIANPGAEAGPGAPDEPTVVAVPFWSTTSNFTAVLYGAAGGFPTPTDPGPAIRGSNFFAGGPSNPSSSASQLIDVGSEAARIDAGRIRFDLSGHLGGFLSQPDNAVLSAVFLDGSNAPLGTAAIRPVTQNDRSNRTGMLPRSVSGEVPTGTRWVDIDLVMSRFEGIYNDGYADNLSLVFHVVPEPVGIVIAGIGFLMLGRLGAFRRKGTRHLHAI